MIEFVSPVDEDEHPLQASLGLALAAPRRYQAFSMLGLHLDRTLRGTMEHLQSADHVQAATGRAFELAAYYADDVDTQAWCAAHQGRFLACVGIGFVCRLVKICDRIGAALLPLSLTAQGSFSRPPPAAADAELAALIRGDAGVGRAEALALVDAWPSPLLFAMECGFGGWALFHELLRLVWVHEVAHALCGHVNFVQDRLGFERLQETRAVPRETVRLDGMDIPRHWVLQSLETHADEFASDYCLSQMLIARDPISSMAAGRIDLATRLVLFNLAACVFAVLWAEGERDAPRVGGEDLIRAPGPAGTPIRPVDSTHPPAAFRYLRYRTLQQRALDRLAEREPEALGVRASVDAHSLAMLDGLARLDPRFDELRVVTPITAQTPQMQRLADYEDMMLDIGDLLAPSLRETGFLPRQP